MYVNPKKAAKEKAERLVQRFRTFLNYDQTIDVKWHSPVDEKNAMIVNKNAVKLAIICAEEMGDSAVLSELIKM